MSTIIPLRRPQAWGLEQAITLAMEQHWAGHRKAANAKSWCRLFLEAFPTRTLATLTTADIQSYIHRLQAEGLQPWTVHARACVISTLYEVAKRNSYGGPVPMIPRPYVPKPLKWWLTPAKEQEVLQWLRMIGENEMADFVQWTVLTGLRVEESLRVTYSAFLGLSCSAPEMVVPGTKTTQAQAAMAVSDGAALLASTRFTATGNQMGPSSVTPLFTMSYRQLDRRWQQVREQFCWMEDSTATLKALRRSFARRLAAKGCPLPVMQQMMRHKDPQTTMGYLRLVGGAFTTEEQRKWL